MHENFKYIGAIRDVTGKLRAAGYPNIATQAEKGKLRIVNVTYPNGPKRAAHVEPLSDWQSAKEILSLMESILANQEKGE